MEERCFVVSPAEKGTRLDLYLKSQAPELSRSRIKQLILEGKVTVNGVTIPKPSYEVKEGERIKLSLPPPEEPQLSPEEIPLEIVYEDEDLVVVNKPQGMVVHPAPGNYRGTLVNALLFHCRDLSGIGGILRPGIVHRLDKDTSGLLVVAKNDRAHLDLAAQIKAREVKRAYLALVHGVPSPKEGTISAPLGRHPVQRQKRAVNPARGKPALTFYTVREEFPDFALVEARLATGRTHQIRVHFAFLGHPVVGDPVYGKRRNPFGLKKQVLHAYLLGFRHPRKNTYLEFQAPLPAYFAEILNYLRAQKSS